MPALIQHRVNTPELLAQLGGDVPVAGAEIDLRAGGGAGEIYLSHDPWVPGAPLGPWLAAYAALGLPGPLVVNTKEDGLEAAFVAAAAAHGVTHFFFLDTALPTLVRHLRRGLGHLFSARLSAHEPLAAVAALGAGLPCAPGWIWADCFEGQPLPEATLRAARAHAKVCLVSPELQGRPLAAIGAMRPLAAAVDAVCTKAPSAWAGAA